MRVEGNKPKFMAEIKSGTKALTGTDGSGKQWVAIGQDEIDAETAREELSDALIKDFDLLTTDPHMPVRFFKTTGYRCPNKGKEFGQAGGKLPSRYELEPKVIALVDGIELPIGDTLKQALSMAKRRVKLEVTRRIMG